MTHRCCQRIPDNSSTLSWIRPHVCRLNHHHPGPHQCTCQHEWETVAPERTDVWKEIPS